MDLYELARGPLVWVALTGFLLGCLYRIASVLLAGRRAKTLSPPDPTKNRIRSVLHGTLPFGGREMRKRPELTVLSWVFHICVVLLPVFLLAHAVLLYESWSLSWWSLPETVTDFMTLAVIVSCLYFLVRRILDPDVRNVTSASDYVLLGIVLLPFLTGFFAFHQWGPYRPILVLHILTGEILLVAIPFTRLSHMLLFLLSRFDLGSDYGHVLKPEDW